MEQSAPCLEKLVNVSKVSVPTRLTLNPIGLQKCIAQASGKIKIIEIKITTKVHDKNFSFNKSNAPQFSRNSYHFK